MSEKKTFFISRAGPDKKWAELIASVVRDAGNEPIYQDEDFGVGESFVHNMKIATEADCTICVFSPAYFESEYCLAELDAAFKADPLGKLGRIIPVLVAPTKIPPLYGPMTYISVIGLDDVIARKRLQTALDKHGRVSGVKRELERRTQPELEQADRNRRAMIQKVRKRFGSRES